MSRVKFVGIILFTFEGMSYILYNILTKKKLYSLGIKIEDEKYIARFTFLFRVLKCESYISRYYLFMFYKQGTHILTNFYLINILKFLINILIFNKIFVNISLKPPILKIRSSVVFPIYYLNKPENLQTLPQPVS